MHQQHHHPSPEAFSATTAICGARALGTVSTMKFPIARWSSKVERTSCNTLSLWSGAKRSVPSSCKLSFATVCVFSLSGFSCLVRWHHHSHRVDLANLAPHPVPPRVTQATFVGGLAVLQSYQVILIRHDCFRCSRDSVRVSATRLQTHRVL